jgi:hypothetical protein
LTIVCLVRESFSRFCNSSNLHFALIYQLWDLSLHFLKKLLYDSIVFILLASSKNI